MLGRLGTDKTLGRTGKGDWRNGQEPRRLVWGWSPVQCIGLLQRAKESRPWVGDVFGLLIGPLRAGAVFG